MRSYFDNGFTYPKFVEHTRTERFYITKQPPPPPPQEGGKKLRKQGFLSPSLAGEVGRGLLTLNF